MIYPLPPPPCRLAAPPTVWVSVEVMLMALGVCVVPAARPVAVAAAAEAATLNDPAETVTVGAL